VSRLPERAITTSRIACLSAPLAAILPGPHPLLVSPMKYPASSSMSGQVKRVLTRYGLHCIFYSND
jgi:hypothetical protein